MPDNSIIVVSESVDVTATVLPPDVYVLPPLYYGDNVTTTYGPSFGDGAAAQMAQVLRAPKFLRLFTG